MSNSFREKARDRILDIMRSNCKDTTQLLSEAMDHDISLTKRCWIKFHLTLCKYCRLYKEQLETIRHLAKGMGKTDSKESTDMTLKPDTKERLKKLMEDQK